jgi:hypothetical protein
MALETRLGNRKYNGSNNRVGSESRNWSGNYEFLRGHFHKHKKDTTDMDHRMNSNEQRNWLKSERLIGLVNELKSSSHTTKSKSKNPKLVAAVKNNISGALKSPRSELQMSPTNWDLPGQQRTEIGLETH